VQVWVVVVPHKQLFYPFNVHTGVKTTKAVAPQNELAQTQGDRHSA
jgi:hypothetical protein